MAKHIDTAGRDIPQNTGVYNAYRRAMQLKNVDWTALADIPNSNGEYTYKTGVKKGIPYSSVKECDKFVGYNVSILTYVTAAHNPYSLLYTENVNADTSKSAYGITYQGVNCGAYFGIVCSIYASYAIGMAVRTNSFEWQWLEKEGIFDKIFEQEANGVMLGDVIWEPGHCSIIVDIYRDERGRVTQIHWSESAGSTPQTSVYTAERFNQRIIDRGGIIYRYKDLYKNLLYIPSQFSLVDDETAIEEYVFNDDICTFAGDYAAFREGELMVINYTKGSYTGCNIYKDDTLLHQLTLDGDADVHSIDLSSLNLVAGKYKATLTGDSESQPTFFEIINTVVNVVGNRNEATISYSSSNAIPMQVEITNAAGYPWGTQSLSEEDINKGYINLNITEFAEKHRPSVALPEICYIKVTFKGDYGSVTNGYNVTL